MFTNSGQNWLFDKAAHRLVGRGEKELRGDCLCGRKAGG